MVALASITGGPSGTALTPANYLRVLADQYHWDVILVTFRLAFYTTLICVALGYPLAWYLVRVVRWRAWRRACVILLVVPLFTSNIVRAFGWMVLLGRNGLVNQALMATGAADRPVRFIGAELGILIGMVYVLLPFVVLAVGNALARVDPACEQASADLGASPRPPSCTSPGADAAGRDIRRHHRLHAGGQRLRDAGAAIRRARHGAVHADLPAVQHGVRLPLRRRAEHGAAGPDPDPGGAGNRAAVPPGGAR